MIVLSDKIKKSLEGFIFPQVEINEWVDKYELSIGRPLYCNKCNTELNPFLPLANKTDRGFMWSICPCGEIPPVTLASADPKEREEDKRFFRLLIESLK